MENIITNLKCTISEVLKERERLEKELQEKVFIRRVLDSQDTYTHANGECVTREHYSFDLYTIVSK